MPWLSPDRCAHGADIRQQGVVGKGRYAYVVEVEHIRRFGVVIIGGEQQAVAEHGKVNTCIEGMFHFPFQVGIVFRKSPNDTAAEFPTGITPFGLTRLSVV